MCRAFVLLALSLLGPAAAAAQSLPAGPVSALDGRLLVGAEVAVTVGAPDETAYFNYTDYEHNALRMVRLALAATWQPSDRLALVGELRTEDFSQPRAYGAYLRLRPWLRHNFDIQVGQIPPSFGAYGRRGYQSTDNPFIGYPLAYQYLTALRPDAVPATTADLVSMRARGWRTTYPIGSQAAAPGVPLISAFRWDTGIQGHWERGAIEVTASVTTGTLSDPRLRDPNGGKQLSGRLGLRPITGLVLGASTARGAFIADNVERLLPDAPGSHAQTAFGADAEYSRDHWLVRGELVWSRWNVPFAWPLTAKDLDALGAWIEGRYRLTPRIVAAGRLGRLGFSTFDVSPGVRATWDAPVTRLELDAGYYLQRNLVLRIAVQHNDRDGGRVRSRTYLSGQIAYWF